jgi:hypothetical protein
MAATGPSEELAASMPEVQLVGKTTEDGNDGLDAGTLRDQGLVKKP